MGAEYTKLLTKAEKYYWNHILCIFIKYSSYMHFSKFIFLNYPHLIEFRILFLYSKNNSHWKHQVNSTLRQVK